MQFPRFQITWLWVCLTSISSDGGGQLKYCRRTNVGLGTSAPNSESTFTDFRGPVELQSLPKTVYANSSSLFHRRWNGT